MQKTNNRLQPGFLSAVSAKAGKTAEAMNVIGDFQIVVKINYVGNIQNCIKKGAIKVQFLQK